MTEGDNFPALGQGFEVVEDLKHWRAYAGKAPVVCPRCGPGAWVVGACLVGAGLVVLAAWVMR